MDSLIKQKLIEKISATNDEQLLQLIKQEIDYFTGEGKSNVLDELSPKDLDELKNLLSEPFGSQTESLEEFQNATKRWRTE